MKPDGRADKSQAQRHKDGDQGEECALMSGLPPKKPLSQKRQRDNIKRVLRAESGESYPASWCTRACVQGQKPASVQELKAVHNKILNPVRKREALF